MKLRNNFEIKRVVVFVVFSTRLKNGSTYDHNEKFVLKMGGKTKHEE